MSLEFQQYPNIIDAGRPDLSSYRNPEFRGSLRMAPLGLFTPSTLGGNGIGRGNRNSSGSFGGNGTTRPGVGGTDSNSHNSSHTSDADQLLTPPHPSFNSSRGGRGGSNVPQGNVPNPNPDPSPNPGIPQGRNRSRNHQQQTDTGSLGSSGPGSTSTNGGRQRHRSAYLDPFALDIQVHHLLSPNVMVQSNLPDHQWDITQEPGALTRERLHLREPAVVYGNAATTLEMGHDGYNKVWIGSDDPTLGWWMRNMWGPLIIEKERGVSAWDILKGIYKYLAQPLTRRDYEKVVESEGVAARMPDTYSPGTIRQHQDLGMMGNNERLRIASQRRIYNSESIQRQLRDSGSLDIPGHGYVWRGGWVNAGEVGMVSCDYRRSDVLGSQKKFAGFRSWVQDDGTRMVYLRLASGS